MTRYLISFDDGAMTFPEEELPDVAKASHAVVDEAKAAGVWVTGAGVQRQRASIVGTDGTVVEGPYPETKAVIGGFCILDVPSREDALEWAAKMGVPLRAGGPRDHDRRGRLIGTTRRPGAEARRAFCAFRCR